MTVQLVHLKGPLQGQIQEFTQNEVVIGSEPSCQVVLPQAPTGIAPRHAELRRDGNRFKMVADPMGRTLVNGKPATETYLKDGDVLTLGDGGVKISFLSQIVDQAPAPAPPPATRRERTTQILMRVARNVFKPGSPDPEAPATPPPPPVAAPAAPPAAPAEELLATLPVVPVKVPLYIQYGPMIRAFETLPVTIGKGVPCEFRIDHPSLLERHAQFFFHEGSYWIKDLTGRGTVQVNRRPASPVARLNQSDRLDLTAQGPSFLFLGGGRLKELVEDFVPEAPPAQARKKTTVLMYLKPAGPQGVFAKLKKFISRSG